MPPKTIILLVSDCEKYFKDNINNHCLHNKFNEPTIYILLPDFAYKMRSFSGAQWISLV